MIRQLRLVVTAEDYDEAVAFDRDVLGMGKSPGGLQLTLFEELDT